ncbi:hypothetical protein D3C87_1638930 [compost metagenome]
MIIMRRNRRQSPQLDHGLLGFGGFPRVNAFPFFGSNIHMQAQFVHSLPCIRFLIVDDPRSGQIEHAFRKRVLVSAENNLTPPARDEMEFELRMFVEIYNFACRKRGQVEAEHLDLVMPPFDANIETLQHILLLEHFLK